MSDRKIIVRFLPFDTDIFGVRCGRIEIEDESMTSEELKNILKEADEQRIDHLVAKVPSEWIKVCNLLEDAKFRFKVCSLDLWKKVAYGLGNIEDICLYNKNADQRLIEITENAFSSGTRFHFEPKFSVNQVAELHKRWIINLINDRDVRMYVHIENAIITGYITVKIKNNTSRRGHIGLFAVDRAYCGKGIGTKLISALDGKLYNNLETLSATTESINYGALKTYFKSGFTIKSSWNVFHFSFS